MSFSGGQEIALITVRLSSVFLTTCACIYFFILWFILKKCSNKNNVSGMANRIILHLMIAIFFDSLTNYLTPGVKDVDALCIIQGIIMQFFQVLTFMWVFVMCVHLFLLFIIGFEREWLELVYIIFSYGWTSVCTIVPLTTWSYGFAGSWCWIKDDNFIDTLWRFLWFYAEPLILVIILIFILYVIIIAKFSVKACQ